MQANILPLYILSTPCQNMFCEEVHVVYQITKIDVKNIMQVNV